MHDAEIPVGYRRCPRCRAANYGRMAKCLRCGSDLPFEAARKEGPNAPEAGTGRTPAKYCHRCGKPVPQERVTKYCRHCGQPILASPEGKG